MWHPLPYFHTALQPITPLRCKKTWIQTPAHTYLGACPSTQALQPAAEDPYRMSGQSTTDSGKNFITSITSGTQLKPMKLLLKWSICIGASPNQGLKKLQISLKQHDAAFSHGWYSLLSRTPLGTKYFGILCLAECKTRSRAAEPTWGAVVEDNNLEFIQRPDKRTNIIKLGIGKEKGHSRTVERGNSMLPNLLAFFTFF